MGVAVGTLVRLVIIFKHFTIAKVQRDFFKIHAIHQNVKMMFYMTILMRMPPLQVYYIGICL